MFKKIFSVITVVVLSLCMFSSLFSVSAVTPERPTIPGGQENGSGEVVENGDKDTEKGNDTGNNTGSNTGSNNTGSNNTGNNNSGNNNSGNNNTGNNNTGNNNTGNNNTGTNRPVYTPPVANDEDEEEDNKVEEETEVVETTEEGLLEGEFYVYLELNNGEERRKRKLSEPDIVGKPNDPVRKGFIFEGWYADAKFKKEWNFAKDIADENTVIYAKWSADPSTIVYSITVKKIKGGYIQTNPDSATAGETVIVRVFPDEGKRLEAGSLTINGKKSDILSFVMPAKDVVISASFERIPASENGDDGISVVPFIFGGAILVVILIAVVVVVTKRRSAIVPVEFDENGAVILDDDDDDDWIDDSIIIEDGFRDGRIIRENIEPDFGESEYDFDD